MPWSHSADGAIVRRPRIIRDGDEQVTRDFLLVYLVRHAADAPEGFDLRGEGDHAVRQPEVIERLLAEMIAHANQPLLTCVPNSESERTHQVDGRGRTTFREHRGQQVRI